MSQITMILSTINKVKEIASVLKYIFRGKSK